MSILIYLYHLYIVKSIFSHHFSFRNGKSSQVSYIMFLKECLYKVYQITTCFMSFATIRFLSTLLMISEMKERIALIQINPFTGCGTHNPDVWLVSLLLLNKYCISKSFLILNFSSGQGIAERVAEEYSTNLGNFVGIPSCIKGKGVIAWSKIKEEILYTADI